MRTVRVLPFSESFAAGLGIAPVVIACRYYCLLNLKLAFSQQDEGPARLVHIIGPVSPRCNCPFLILANRLIDV